MVELHGNIWRVRCIEEGKITENLDVPLPSIPPRCECGALLRPDVVWFGEALPADALQMAFAAAESCDVFLVVGTSAVVQPAASLPMAARQQGAYVVEVNLQPTPLSSLAHEVYHGKAGDLLPGLFGFPSGLSGNFEFRNSIFEMSSPDPQRPTPNPSM
jgi:NAD-dependent deacetylase